MRVLLAINSESPFVPIWVKAYLRAGISIDIVSRFGLLRSPHRQRVLDAYRRLRNADVRVLDSSRSVRPTTPMEYPRVALRVAALTQRYEYDGMHAHFLQTRGFMTHFSAARRTILSPYGSDVFRPGLWGWSAPRPLVNAVIKSVIRTADLILPTSRHMAQYLTDVFDADSSRMFTMPWGIDLDEWRSPSPRAVSPSVREMTEDLNGIVFISYRTAKPVYRVHLLPLIHHLLLKRGIDSTFIYCMNTHGDDPYVQRVLGLIRRLGLEDRSRVVLRPLSPPDLRFLLDRSDYFFSIPTWDQLAQTLLEGLYAGVVPIVSPMPAYADVFDHGAQGVIVEPDPHIVARRLQEAINARLHEDEDMLMTNRRVIEAHYNQMRNMGLILRRIVDVLYA